MVARSQLRRRLSGTDNFITMHRRLSSALALTGSSRTLNTMRVLRMRNLNTMRMITGGVTVRSPLHRVVVPEHLDQVRRVLDTFTESRRLATRPWLLHDAVDPAAPRTVRGLEEALPARRKRFEVEVEAGDQTRAGMRYRHRCAADPPGRLVTARCRVPRGPNTRLLTDFCQQAG